MNKNIILFLTNNNITEPLIRWLNKNNSVIVFSKRLNIEYLNNLQPDLIISYNYHYIIPKKILLYYPKIINLHISYLPWNRGTDPNFWSFIDNTIKGVTIHYINEKIDAGDILLQKELVFNEEVETLESSYLKLNNEIQKLFIDNYLEVINDKIPTKKQIGEGSFHYKYEFEKIKNIIGEKIYIIKIKELKSIIKNLKLL